MTTSLPNSPEPSIKTFFAVFDSGVPIVVMNFALAEKLLVAIRLRRLYVERAFVNCTPRNRAENAGARSRFQRTDVIHIGNAAGRDHRNRRRLRHGDGCLDVDTLHHAVATD